MTLTTWRRLRATIVVEFDSTLMPETWAKTLPTDITENGDLCRLGQIPGDTLSVSVEYADEKPEPPEDLADAWRRYQEGGEVTQNELRQLDEWRIDMAVDF